jgi:hypothetical protein
MMAGPLCRLSVLNANPLPMEFAAGDGKSAVIDSSLGFVTDPLGRLVCISDK